MVTQEILECSKEHENRVDCAYMLNEAFTEILMSVGFTIHSSPTKHPAEGPSFRANADETWKVNWPV